MFLQFQVYDFLKLNNEKQNNRKPLLSWANTKDFGVQTLPKIKGKMLKNELPGLKI